MAKLLPTAAIIRRSQRVYVTRWILPKTYYQEMDVEIPYPPTDFQVTISQSFDEQLTRGHDLLVFVRVVTDRTQWVGKYMRGKLFIQTGYQGDHQLAYFAPTERIVVDEVIDYDWIFQIGLPAVPKPSGITTTIWFTEVGLTGSPPFPLIIGHQVGLFVPSEVVPAP